MPRTRNILLAIAIAIALAVGTTSPAALAAVPRATLGAAFAQGNISLFRTAQSNGLHLVWAREFWAGSVPASLSAWPAAAQAHQLGLKLWLSVDVGPDALAAGNYDAQLARFARTLPPGTRLTFMHEPSVKTKHYTPARFVAGFNHAAQVVRRVAPLVLTGPIDVRFNILTERFMDNLNPALVDFVGIDGYDGINGGPPGQEVAGLVQPQGAHPQGRFPPAPTGGPVSRMPPSGSPSSPRAGPRVTVRDGSRTPWPGEGLTTSSRCASSLPRGPTCFPPPSNGRWPGS